MSRPGDGVGSNGGNNVVTTGRVVRQLAGVGHDRGGNWRVWLVTDNGDVKFLENARTPRLADNGVTSTRKATQLVTAELPLHARNAGFNPRSDGIPSTTLKFVPKRHAKAANRSAKGMKSDMIRARNLTGKTGCGRSLFTLVG
jgi:hypothetical protein